jgi:hypothetical protein
MVTKSGGGRTMARMIRLRLRFGFTLVTGA